MAMDNEIISLLDSIDKRLAAIEQRLSLSSLTSPSTLESKLVSRQLSITEYLLSNEPSDDNQRALVLAGYLENYRKKPDFTGEELRQAFIDCRLKAPVNVSDKIAKLAKKGLVMQVGERDGRKTWCLTMTGISQLEEGF
jgi:hypothetical protein